MRILDLDGNELTEIDESLGYTVEETIVVAHHDAVEAVPEQGHYEVIKRYQNGGEIVEWRVDVPGVKAEDAWDETEDILRYHPYPEDVLAKREREREEAEREEAERQESAMRDERKAQDNIEYESVFEWMGSYYRATETILCGEEILPDKNCEWIDIGAILKNLIEKGEL
jgi:hypothetical protein